MCLLGAYDLITSFGEVGPMVMRNRQDGANAPQWWDDLPPEIKKRCANSPYLRNSSALDRDLQDPFAESSLPPVKVTRDLFWLAFMFVVIAFANILLVFAALSLLHDRGAFGN
jgi:hypothetical protein